MADLKNNLFPDIQFEEINDSPRPAQVGSVNRIGIVGTFRKGLKNTFRLISSYDQFSRVYGATTHLGSVAVQAAMDQGADDFGLVRVMGSAKRSSTTLSVTVPDATAVEAGNLTVTFQRFQSDNSTQVGTDIVVTVAVVDNQTGAQIANAIAQAINASTALSAYITAVYESGTSVTLQADVAGLAGNYFKVALAGPVVGVTAMSPASATNFSGGADGPKKSSHVIKDRQVVPVDLLRIDAVSEGLWGDDVTYTITNGSTATKFNLILKDTYNNHQETYFDLDLSNELYFSADTKELLLTRNSNIAKIYLVAVGNSSSEMPEISTDVALAGGSDGPAITTDDYIEALKVLKNNTVNIILAAGQTDASIRSALISQAEDSDPITGYRIAVLNADKNMDIESLDSVSQSFNTNSGSAVMVAGWATYAGQPRLSRFGASPDGFYAGHMAVTPIQVSPAARSSSPFIQNVVEVDTQMTEQAFNSYTKARMEALVLDPATGGFHCLNGRTLSSDGAWYWVSIRRVYNQVKNDLFRMVQWVKSQPNTSALRNQLGQQIDTYMGILLSRGVIAATKKSLVDSTNNPADRVASGYLRAEAYFVPVFPADHVVIGIHRYLSADVLV